MLDKSDRVLKEKFQDQREWMEYFAEMYFGDIWLVLE